MHQNRGFLFICVQPQRRMSRRCGQTNHKLCSFHYLKSNTITSNEQQQQKWRPVNVVECVITSAVSISSELTSNAHCFSSLLCIVDCLSVCWNVLSFWWFNESHFTLDAKTHNHELLTKRSRIRDSFLQSLDMSLDSVAIMLSIFTFFDVWLESGFMIWIAVCCKQSAYLP